MVTPSSVGRIPLTKLLKLQKVIPKGAQSKFRRYKVVTKGAQSKFRSSKVVSKGMQSLNTTEIEGEEAQKSFLRGCKA
jgi:ribosome-associated protein YbcJ (S4-like RNA binding protein)